MKVKFLKNRTVQDGSGTTFQAGAVYDLPEDSAQRWIRRHVAIRVDEPPAVANPAESLKVAPAPEKPAEPEKSTEPPVLAKAKPDAMKVEEFRKHPKR